MGGEASAAGWADPAEAAAWIKAEAARLGFDAAGITRPHRIDPCPYAQWVEKGFTAGLRYLERNPSVWCDPWAFFPEVRSIVSLALSYNNPSLRWGSPLRVSRYAWGMDYHDVVRSKLKRLLSAVEERLPGARGRVAVDTAPVAERYWAQQAGLGWIGRNGLLIVPGLGSWVFLGEVFLNLDLRADEPARDRCGDCRACLDACPSRARGAAGILDLRLCVSYWTVEHKGAFPASGVPSIAPWLFGCDRCQEVCPWNEGAAASSHEEFLVVPPFSRWSKEQWRIELATGRFPESGSPLLRAGREGLLRNLERLAAEGT